jgi:hypothetical protein
MAGVKLETYRVSIPYDGELQEGLVLLGYVWLEVNYGVVCSCFHDGKWENLSNAGSTAAVFSNISLANGILSFDIGSGGLELYVSVFQTDGLPTN